MNSKPRFRFGMASVTVLALALVSGGARAENALIVGSGSAADGGVADIPLKLSCDEDAQAFVMIFEWDATRAVGVDLIPATASGEALATAQLIVKRIERSYMILSAIMDTDGTGGEKIPAGQNIKVGTAKILCNQSGDPELKLVDNKYATVDGGPLLSNLITIGGRTVGKAEGLNLKNGNLVCGEVPPEEGVVFTCGGPLGSDDIPNQPKASRKETETIFFYYKSPMTGPGNKNKIQGLSMAVKFHKDLTCLEDSFNLDDGVLKEVNAEFVHLEVDNLIGDGDPAEFTLGVLVDAKSPYDGRTLPSTSTYKMLFSLDFEVEGDAPCDDCLPIQFTEGLNGNGQVLVYNVASINFYPVIPKKHNCTICVEKAKPKFVRGDCNFTFGGARAIDISDAAAMVGYFFLEGDAAFAAPCDDACDANDDGKLDAADVVFILNYMFVPGSKFPPPPGPTTPGPDPTDDKLGCKGAEPEC